MRKIYTDELIAALEELSSLSAHYYYKYWYDGDDSSEIKGIYKLKSNAIGIEFGTVGYLTCMKYCEFMIGNTSSGFVEASFSKSVINLGNSKRENQTLIFIQ
jgi:GDP/UDP-N,N'-diacetylbacillosamine 2-epimerase (hydrolysing)